MSDAILGSCDSSVASDVPAGPYDQWLRQATDRLRTDPELQREVRQELLGHLEDAAAEHQASGIPDVDARGKAMAAVGDAAELSQKLFQTHQRRLRHRRILKWTLGIALIPGAVAIAVAVGWGAPNFPGNR
jgi:hypothetical protein